MIASPTLGLNELVVETNTEAVKQAIPNVGSKSLVWVTIQEEGEAICLDWTDVLRPAYSRLG